MKNWVWTRINKSKSETDYRQWFALLKECGISGVMFEGYDENLYRMCKEAGLEAHFWKWTMNRAELLNVHPDWFAVNRKGSLRMISLLMWIITVFFVPIMKEWPNIWQMIM